ncbi:LAFA_0G22980g1_1 [Lachancea sp. 'fantastica']|nr:LAFA_0G22980g1_1 [Lachancea sp. 'fantastica']
MPELKDIYELIANAELKVREHNFEESINVYLETVKLIEEFESKNKGFDQVEDVKTAIELLKIDIESKVWELQQLNLRAKTPAAKPDNVAAVKNPMTTTESPQTFVENVLNLVRSKTELKPGASVHDLETGIAAETTQLLRGLSWVDQQRSKEYEARIEELCTENKQLTTQIHKLKERWDSLVESARQKRNQQND